MFSNDNNKSYEYLLTLYYVPGPKPIVSHSILITAI